MIPKDFKFKVKEKGRIYYYKTKKEADLHKKRLNGGWF